MSEPLGYFRSRLEFQSWQKMITTATMLSLLIFNDSTISESPTHVNTVYGAESKFVCEPDVPSRFQWSINGDNVNLMKAYEERGIWIDEQDNLTSTIYVPGIPINNNIVISCSAISLVSKSYHTAGFQHYVIPIPPVENVTVNFSGGGINIFWDSDTSPKDYINIISINNETFISNETYLIIPGLVPCAIYEIVVIIRDIGYTQEQSSPVTVVKQFDGDPIIKWEGYESTTEIGRLKVSVVTSTSVVCPFKVSGNITTSSQLCNFTVPIGDIHDSANIHVTVLPLMIDLSKDTVITARPTTNSENVIVATIFNSSGVSKVPFLGGSINVQCALNSQKMDNCYWNSTQHIILRSNGLILWAISEDGTKLIIIHGIEFRPSSTISSISQTSVGSSLVPSVNVSPTPGPNETIPPQNSPAGDSTSTIDIVYTCIIVALGGAIIVLLVVVAAILCGCIYKKLTVEEGSIKFEKHILTPPFTEQKSSTCIVITTNCVKKLYPVISKTSYNEIVAVHKQQSGDIMDDYFNEEKNKPRPVTDVDVTGKNELVNASQNVTGNGSISRHPPHSNINRAENNQNILPLDTPQQFHDGIHLGGEPNLSDGTELEESDKVNQYHDVVYDENQGDTNCSGMNEVKVSNTE